MQYSQLCYEFYDNNYNLIFFSGEKKKGAFTCNYRMFNETCNLFSQNWDTFEVLKTTKKLDAEPHRTTYSKQENSKLYPLMNVSQQSSYWNMLIYQSQKAKVRDENKERTR